MDLSVLAQLPTLRTLDLSGCTLSSAAMSTIVSLPELTSLNLSGCAVIDINALIGLQKLEFLDLSNNTISDLTALSALQALKELHLTKTLSPSGKYRYSAPAADEFPGYDERLKKIFRECVTSYAEAQNIIVIKTLPGLASAACAALDSMHIETLVGTLAGDDTAFLLMKDNTSADELFQEIEKLL